MPERLQRPDADAVSDAVQRQRGLLEQLTGALHTLADEPGVSGLARGRLEFALQCARTHGRVRGHGLDAQGSIQVFAQPVQQQRQPAALVPRHRARHELRLPALAMRRYDQPARHLVGDLRAVIPAHQVNEHIEPRGRARRRQDPVLVGVQRVGFYPDRAAVRLAQLNRPVKLMIGGITGWLDEGFELSVM